MPIKTTNPIAISEPNVPFDNLAISVAISPLWEDKYVGASVSLVLTPYRILADGTIEKSNNYRTVSIVDAYKEAETDPVLAQAVQSIYGALAQYVADKGL
jgi:hypothetical protein